MVMTESDLNSKLKPSPPHQHLNFDNIMCGSFCEKGIMFLLQYNHKSIVRQTVREPQNGSHLGLSFLGSASHAPSAACPHALPSALLFPLCSCLPLPSP